MNRQRLLRIIFIPVLWFFCMLYPACPECGSRNGTVVGYTGDHGKSHGYPDYAPPTIKHYHCMACKHSWQVSYHQHSDLYYQIFSFRYWPARFLSRQNYYRILNLIDD